MKGKNSEVVHKNERYHIQTESWAPEEDVLITQIFKGGQVVLKKKVKPTKGQGLLLDEKAIDKAHSDAITELKELFI